MQINPSIFKAYDIRGIYPQDINEQNIVEIVKAIYTFFVQDLKRESLSIVLGRDMRTSSPTLFEKAQQTLVEMGATVIDVSLVSTPTIYFAILNGKYDAGVQISASHNPKEYNGIKFTKRIDQALIKIGKGTGMEQVKELALSQNFFQSGKKGKIISKNDVLEDEISQLLKEINLTNLKKFKVVADPANAMAALYLEKLFAKLQCDLIKLNFELDGTFPAHQADPLQFSTLKELQERVIQEKADFGIATDGDGDRIFFIDENGNVVKATLITSLIAKEILKKKPGARILADIRDIKNVQVVCQKYGGEFGVSKVGHALITEQLNRENAVFAGESSGHYFFRNTGGAESPIQVILYVLSELNRENKTISQLLKQYESWAEAEEINFIIEDDSKSILDKFIDEYKDGELSTLDGIAIDFPDWRFNIRTSNTEPLLRLNVEAANKEILAKNFQELITKLEAAGAKRK